MLARSKFRHVFDSLDEKLKIQARRLADLAKRGRLVLFLGSGISAGAGMPTWQTLLDSLAAQAGMSPEEIELLHKVWFFCNFLKFVIFDFFF